MAGKTNIYWDTCVFLTYLQNEKRDEPNDMHGIEEIVESFDSGSINLVASVITITEILPNPSSENIVEDFDSLSAKTNFFLVGVTRKIARIGQELRNFYHKENEPQLSTPDSLHLATAIIMNCEKLYTFDGCSKVPDKKSIQLLRLPNPIAGKYELKILRPSPSDAYQYKLDTQD